MSFLEIIFDNFLNINIPPQYYVDANNNQQIVKNMKWSDVFNKIKSEHWHCKGKKTTPHAESLYQHLLDTARINYEKATKMGLTSHDCLKAWFAGLLHDVGKPGTIKESSTHLAFKGHGLVGGALIENMWSEELTEKFNLTKEDWGDISTVADVHMCGYFPGQKTNIHRFSFNILPNNIKNLLYILSFGDQLSMEPHHTFNMTKKQIYDNVMNNQDYLNKALFKKYDFNEFIEDTNIKKGVLIQIQGTSAVGKSTLAKKLINILGKDKAVHINRDYYMVNRTHKIIGLPTISNQDNLNPVMYQNAYGKYVESGKRWADQINNDMKKDIFEALQLGKIVILDTMATMFEGSALSIIPEVAINSYKINFWVHRNQEITNDESVNRLGMSLNSQLTAHGESDLYNPFRKNIAWYQMISLTEKDDIIKSTNGAHLSISVGWNNCKEHVISHLCNTISEIYQYNQTISRVPVLEQTMNMSLFELVKFLRPLNGISEFFKSYNYNVSNYVPGVVGIKYIDGINTIWKPRWAREARGRQFYIGSDINDEVVELKSCLQRGIEVLTKAHIKSGINETQDITPKSWELVDDIQLNILKTFSDDNEYHGYITGKVDGSLMMINIYPSASKQYNIIKKLIIENGDIFTKNLLNVCLDNNLPIITVSTQGTLFIGDEMQDYFLTCIQPLLGVEFDNISDWYDNNYAKKFVDMIYKFYQELSMVNQNEMINITLEGYCKNRTTITGKIHTELAVGYDHSGIILLGLMNENKYYPHFDLPKIIFKQPIHKFVKSTTEIFNIMKLLDDIVEGKKTNEDLIGLCDENQMACNIIHPEGWVLLTKTGDTYDYAKIKTELYYKCHKIKEKNIKELLNLPESSQKHYPILINLHQFFDKLTPTLFNVVETCYELLENELNIESKFYKSINSKAKMHIDNYISTQDKIKKMVSMKIYLNAKECVDFYDELFGKFLNGIYPYRCCSMEDLVQFAKKLLMKLEPWLYENSEGYSEKLNKMINDYDETINQLYGLIVGYEK